MQGNSNRPLLPARLAAVLLSATVVLAFALPSFAQADSAGAQYHDGLPTATGKKKQKSGSHDNNSGSGGQVNGSGSSGGSSGGTGSGSGGQGGSGSSPAPSGPSPAGPDSGASANSSANQSGATGGQGAGSGEGKSVKLAAPTGADYQVPTSDGGSSPLGAVLIAIAVLVVISAVVVVLRSRRRRFHDEDGLDPPYAG